MACREGRGQVVMLVAWAQHRTWHSMTQNGIAWHGREWHYMAQHCMHGTAQPGTARHPRMTQTHTLCHGQYPYPPYGCKAIPPWPHCTPKAASPGCPRSDPGMGQSSTSLQGWSLGVWAPRSTFNLWHTTLQHDLLLSPVLPTMGISLAHLLWAVSWSCVHL